MTLPKTLSFRFAARASLIAALAAGVSACVVGPKYQAPHPAPVEARVVDPQTFAAGKPDADWWKLFDDPTLSDLVARARRDNLDLRIALDRVREARSLFQDRALDRFPRVTSEASYSHAVEQLPGFVDKPVAVDSPSVGFDATWEIDLFGRVRHVVASARADAQAAAADLDGAQITVEAEVARNYLELRGAQGRRRVAEANVATQRETLRLTRIQVEVGRGDPVDVESARARAEATAATIPDLVAQEAQANHRLCVLLGLRPGALDGELAARTGEVAPRVTPLPIGDPSGFLRRRPDVRAAERRLAAETARTGVSTADLFPRLQVTGFVGLLSGDVSGLFKSSGEAWSVAPAVTWPAFDFAGAQARLRAQKARGDVAEATYDKTVLQAIEDLDNALVGYRQQQARIVSLSQELDAARRAADLAHVRYKEGDIDFLRLLDAERTRLEAEDSLTDAETRANTDVVAIYKALGGGWS